MLNVKVGDEVCIIGRSKEIARVEHVTPSGRFRAAGTDFDPDGRQRGAIGTWSIRLRAHLVTDFDRQEVWRRDALGRLFNLRGVADSLTDDQLRRMIAILEEES